MTLRRLFQAMAAIAGLSIAMATPQVAAADTSYPDKPIRLIIPFGAGGITDVAGRLIGQYLGEALSQQIVIENRPGAGGAIAAQTLATAKPDGYTLLLGTVGTQVVNPMLYSELNYDPASFTPVSLVSNSPYVLAINGIEKVKDLQGLVRYAKAHPGELNFGSAGNGSSPHLGMELFKLATQTDIVHIPFKSGAEAVNAAVGGQVNIVIDALPVIAPQAKAERLKMLAIAAAERSPAAPDLKTSAEEGIAGFQIGSWNALVAPPGTPDSQVKVLNKALAEAFARPELVSKLAKMGIEVLPTGVKAYQSHVASETEKWSRVIKTAGTRLG
ncbi:MAG: tripartite tricarboxylate transporter substrate binding protein [Burkholderiaceae bacterium]